MTHGPPHRILDRTVMGVFVGCEALAPRLEQLRPALCVFGHIHEARGAVIKEWEDDDSGRRKRTVYVNAAVQASRNHRNQEVGPIVSFFDVEDIADPTLQCLFKRPDGRYEKYLQPIIVDLKH